MPDQDKFASNFYALLIGIDVYEPNNQFDDLGGAARDINLVADYLEKTLGISEEAGQLCRLTSPSPTVAKAFPKKDPLPTYRNIVKAFEEVTNRAQTGDQVYIHYSGHGVRAQTIYPDLEAKQWDEGIVPMDLATDGRYLRDVELTTLLKRMTDKGLFVTVVLDSCNSGGATRGDTKIRGTRSGGAPDLTDRPKESLVEPVQATLEATWRALVERAPNKVAAGWAPASQEYVLLAACRPTEEAYEYVVNPKSSPDSHGALTYWMLDTLKSSPPNLSYKLLHDRLCAKIHSKFARQIPMLVGDGDRKVFGSDRLVNTYTVAVLSANVDKKRVTLNAGLVQGLSEGARFAIYPLGTSDFSKKDQELVVVEVTENVDPSTCTAKMVDIDEKGLKALSDVEKAGGLAGFPAVMLSAPTALVRSARLFEKSSGNAEDQLPPELISQQSTALEAVRQALASNGWVREEPEKADFQVAVGKDGTYEICEGKPIENLGTPLKITDPNSPAEVVKRLIHLTKYKTFESLINPDSDIENQLIFELLDEDKQPFPDPQNIVFVDGDVVHLKIKNNSELSLNIAILDLEPTWEISQIPVQSIDEVFYNLSKDDERTIKLRPRLPEKEGYEGAVEILKLFATGQIADFRWMQLPALDEAFPTARGRGLKQGFSEKLDEMRTRGETPPPVSPLNDLLVMIGGDVDTPPQTRAMAREFGSEWATKTVSFRIERIVM